MNDFFRVDRISENPKSRVKWKTEQIQYIIKEYLDGKSIKKLANAFSVHQNTIKKVLQDNDLHIRNLEESKQEKNVNYHIFDRIDTEEKAYWLGFIAADGCVSNNYIIISLQKRDKHHLEKFARFLGCDNSKIKDYELEGKEYSNFKFGSVAICKALNQWGILERKSLILQPPLFLEEENLKKAWARGYFDGDGGISLSKNKKRAQLYCTSTKEVLNWLISFLELNTTPILEHNCKNTYRISINGFRKVKEKATFLYKDATIFLDRKYQIYESLCQPRRKELFQEEVLLWGRKNKNIILSCPKNKISFYFSEIFEIGKKYNYDTPRSVARNFCGSESLKKMLEYLQNLLHQ